MEPAIRVEDLGKLYRVTKGAQWASYTTLRDTLAHAAGAPFRWARKGFAPPDPAEDFWALKGVDFEVQPGEVVGIIGRNGAGKSTLLKILSRITKPTTGRVTLNGRVGSLLEVGTGFHPELTGRENVYLNGSILGMSRREIAKKFDEIVAFAEIDRFLDTPVKRYSSGMYVRLAFAVAAHLEPEILIVDEVLAVGDAAFQKKCMGKMQDVGREGRTVIFVSHNITAIQSLCSRVVHMTSGMVAFNGDAKVGIASYLQSGINNVITTEQTWPDDLKSPGGGPVRLLAARIVAEAAKPAAELTITDGFIIEFEYRVVTPGIKINLSLHLYNQDGILIIASPSLIDEVWAEREFSVGIFKSMCSFPGSLLNDGDYYASVWFVLDSTNVIDRIEQAIHFHINESMADRRAWYGKWGGVVRPQLKWKTVMSTNSI